MHLHRYQRGRWVCRLAEERKGRLRSSDEINRQAQPTTYYSTFRPRLFAVPLPHGPLTSRNGLSLLRDVSCDNEGHYSLRHAPRTYCGGYGNRSVGSPSLKPARNGQYGSRNAARPISTASASPFGQNARGLLGLGDQSDRGHRNIGLLANLLRERHLIPRASSESSHSAECRRSRRPPDRRHAP